MINNMLMIGYYQKNQYINISPYPAAAIRVFLTAHACNDRRHSEASYLTIQTGVAPSAWRVRSAVLHANVGSAQPDRRLQS